MAIHLKCSIRQTDPSVAVATKFNNKIPSLDVTGRFGLRFGMVEARILNRARHV